MSYQVAHDSAVAAGELTYLDPETGYKVFTKLGLEARGNCCGCGCRHCPYQHEAVPGDQRAAKIKNPAWLTDPVPESARVLFWSGGKDSYLALRAMQRSSPEPVALLTTFDSETRVVAHQEIPLDVIRDQAQRLGVGLIGVPLIAGVEYIEQVVDGLLLVPKLNELAFGDLHLEHIKRWRQEAFEALVNQGVRLSFPIWHVAYDDLLADLEASGARCEIAAVTHPDLSSKVGELFSRQFVESLSDDIDAFGENGEFHTCILPVSDS